MDLNPGFIGQVIIPIVRLPEAGETIEQWYQLSPKDSAKTTRASVKLALRFEPELMPPELPPPEVSMAPYSFTTRGRAPSYQPTREEGMNSLATTPAAHGVNIQLEDDGYPAR